MADTTLGQMLANTVASNSTVIVLTTKQDGFIDFDQCGIANGGPINYELVVTYEFRDEVFTESGSGTYQNSPFHAILGRTVSTSSQNNAPIAIDGDTNLVTINVPLNLAVIPWVSNTPGEVPPTLNAEKGQIGINEADQKMFAPFPNGAPWIVGSILAVKGYSSNDTWTPSSNGVGHLMGVLWGSGGGAMGNVGIGGTTGGNTSVGSYAWAGGGHGQATDGTGAQGSASGNVVSAPGLGAPGGYLGGEGGMAVFYANVAGIANATIVVGVPGTGGSLDGGGNAASGTKGCVWLIELP